MASIDAHVFPAKLVSSSRTSRAPSHCIRVLPPGLAQKTASWRRCRQLECQGRSIGWQLLAYSLWAQPSPAGGLRAGRTPDRGTTDLATPEHEPAVVLSFEHQPLEENVVIVGVHAAELRLHRRHRLEQLTPGEALVAGRLEDE